jgi:hypothetical protein
MTKQRRRLADFCFNWSALLSLLGQRPPRLKPVQNIFTTGVVNLAKTTCAPKRRQQKGLSTVNGPEDKLAIQVDRHKWLFERTVNGSLNGPILAKELLTSI